MPLIGEGRYGCVYEPPLDCNQPKRSGYYHNKITKVTSSSNADKEIEKQKLIDEVDPSFNYHLPPPNICSPDIKNTNNLELLQQCSMVKTNELSPENIMLLTIQNGGLDLGKFVHYIVSNKDSIVLSKDSIPSTSNKEKKLNKMDKKNNSISKKNNSPVTEQDDSTEKYNNQTHISSPEIFETKKVNKNKIQMLTEFWINSFILFEALDDFIKNKVIHADLKQSNILYNYNTGRFNIIDFSLTKRMEEFDTTIAHFSYPPETYICDPVIYEDIKKLSNKKFYEKLGIKPFNTGIPFMGSYDIFMDHIVPKDINEPRENHHELIHRYGFLDKEKILKLFNVTIYQTSTIKQLKKQSVLTHDMYGLGMSLLYVLVRTYHLFDSEVPTVASRNSMFIKKMYKLLFSMVHPDCFKRPSITVLKNKYTEILQLLRPINTTVRPTRRVSYPINRLLKTHTMKRHKSE